jgi:hypothetical protein
LNDWGRAVVLLAALAPGAACSGGPTILSKTAPDAAHTALVRMVRCDRDWCQELAVGDRPEVAQTVATLRYGTERCDEIVWTRDGKRVGSSSTVINCACSTPTRTRLPASSIWSPRTPRRRLVSPAA